MKMHSLCPVSFICDCSLAPTSFISRHLAYIKVKIDVAVEFKGRGKYGSPFLFLPCFPLTARMDDLSCLSFHKPSSLSHYYPACWSKLIVFVSGGSVGGVQGQAMCLHVVNIGLLGDQRLDLGCSTALMPIIYEVSSASHVFLTLG